MTLTNLSDLSEVQQQAIRRLAADHVGAPFTTDYAGGGRNSRIYRLAGGHEPTYALKVYFQNPGDPRDRPGTEFGGLSFLWQNGVRTIPRPVELCSEAGIALYEFIEGVRIPAESLTELEIDAAVDFVACLQSLTGLPGAAALNAASEAYFFIEGTYQNIQRRLTRLIEGQQGQEAEPALDEFLRDDLVPSLEKISRWSRARSGWGQEIALDMRTLSPSDFGFHNAIRRNGIVFLDFEYFGWDDPAKLISDFILHPAMTLDYSLARRFAGAVVKQFDGRLVERVKSVYPLFGLKWCLILLNEFLPEHRLRRQFAAAAAQDWAAVRANQLAKARQVLSRINQEYERFPYFD